MRDGQTWYSMSSAKCWLQKLTPNKCQRLIQLDFKDESSTLTEIWYVSRTYLKFVHKCNPVSLSIQQTGDTPGMGDVVLEVRKTSVREAEPVYDRYLIQQGWVV